MKSKWNYDQPRQNQSRPKRKRILIVTEGKVTEPLYFDSLKKYCEIPQGQLEIYIEAAPDHDGNTPERVVSSAKMLKNKEENRARRARNNSALTDADPYDDVWVVFDTEREGKNPNLKNAADSAAAAKLCVAISYPSFESWFLLHLRDGLPAMSDCDSVVREIHKIFPGGYRKNSPKNRDLKSLIESILDRKKTTEAIERAKRIEKTAFTDHPHVPIRPGTKIHVLVEEIWKSSPKGQRDLR
jgi:hypothetical protein